MRTASSKRHLAIRETYRRAMAERKTQREAFDLALALLLEKQPQALRAARRAVAVMLAYEPYLLPPAPAAAQVPVEGYPGQKAEARMHESAETLRSAA